MSVYGRDSEVFRYVCEHVVPGCSHEDEDAEEVNLLERIGIHLTEEHDLDHEEDRVAHAIKTAGVNFIRPV